METNDDAASVISSSASTPSPPSPFQPKFSLRFTNQISKDGDIVTYTIRIIPTDGTFNEQIIQRQYEDFEWLEHCVTAAANIHGIIVPPLPPRPAVTTQMLEAKTKRQFGSCSRELRGDGFFKDSRAMEMYLHFLLSHNTFGIDVALKDFLTKTEAPPRTKIKQGILTMITSRMENWKSFHRDSEEFFQKEKEWVDEYGKLNNNVLENLNKVICSQQKICNSIGHLSTALNVSFCCADGLNGVSLSRFVTRFAGGLNDLKQSIEVQIHNDELTLVTTFEFYARYIQAEKEMLSRRTSLAIEYENCNKALEKVKNDKFEQVQNAKIAAEKSFEECSDVARQEIKGFHRQRVVTLQEAVKTYIEAQLKVACDTYAILANCLIHLEHMTCPSAKE